MAYINVDLEAYSVIELMNDDSLFAREMWTEIEYGIAS